MFLKRTLLTTVVLPVTLSSCKSGGRQGETPVSLTPAEEAACLERGDQAVSALMEKLSTQLKVAMKSGGPENAVKVCQQVAQPITGFINTEFEGLTISRVSLNYRNPKNAPDDTDRRILKKWQGLLDEEKALPVHELISLPEEQILFYKPIEAQKICLRCHGDRESFSPNLQALLNQQYPGDKAHGYREGDLRGAFRVVIDLRVKPF